MIEIKNEKINPLPENMAERYRALYRLQSDLTKKSECISTSIDIQFFDGDDRRIRSILVRGKDQEGNDVSYFKNYYRNGQLSEGGRIKNGQYEEHISFYEDGTPEKSALTQAIKGRLQKDI